MPKKRNHGLVQDNVPVHERGRVLFVGGKERQEMKCCHGCVAPKRHEACWGHCPEHIQERAEYDLKKAAEDMKNAVRNGIYMQRCDGVYRAAKRHGSNRKK